MSLCDMIERGELIIPEHDCCDLFENISDQDLRILIDSGEVILSDGEGNGFLIRLPLGRLKNLKPEHIRIIKLPYSRPW